MILVPSLEKLGQIFRGSVFVRARSAPLGSSTIIWAPDPQLQLKATAPSGRHAGCPEAREPSVRGRTSPPCAGTRKMRWFAPATGVSKAIVFPSGDHAGHSAPM